MTDATLTHRIGAAKTLDGLLNDITDYVYVEGEIESILPTCFSVLINVNGRQLSIWLNANYLAPGEIDRMDTNGWIGNVKLRLTAERWREITEG